MRKLTLTLSAVVLLVLVAGCDEESAGECPGMTATILQVVDGDTIKVNELEGAIRLLGINAPETSGTNPSACPMPYEEMDSEQQSQYVDECCFGDQAKAALTEWLPVGTEICLVNPKGGDLEVDMYGRYLADLYLENSWLNGKMVAGGYARPYSDFPHPTLKGLLEDLEIGSFGSNAGLWGACTISAGGGEENPCD